MNDRGGVADAVRPLALGFFAPSGFVPDPALMDRAAQFLATRGWRVSAGDSVFARDLRFAGPDVLRAEELQAFATDRRLDAAVAARGGYGLSRLLDRIDYAAIAAARVPIVGYSDFTAFNLALLARAGGASFQGPAASDFAAAGAALGAGGPAVDSEFTMRHFFAALTHAVCAVEFEPAEAPPPPASLDVRGRLWGGNLSMICSLLGTPYFPRVAGGILFLEDVNEPAYRIERMMLQLLHAGVLARQRAIVLGDFAPVPCLGTDNGYALASVWPALQGRCNVPFVGGLPFGHGRRRVTLAVGVPARLTVGPGRARIEYRGHPTVRAR